MLSSDVGLQVFIADIDNDCEGIGVPDRNRFLPNWGDSGSTPLSQCKGWSPCGRFFLSHTPKHDEEVASYLTVYKTTRKRVEDVEGLSAGSNMTMKKKCAPMCIRLMMEICLLRQSIVPVVS